MNLLNTQLVTQAADFARFAHARIEHVRKYSGEPYFVHLEEVAGLVASVDGATEAMVAAAYLHDTVEDTGVLLEEIRQLFGEQVASHVDDLTDKFVSGQGWNRAERKTREATRLGQVQAGSQTIKVADLISNSPSIVANDPAFASVYLAEKERLLEALTLADSGLRDQAAQVLLEGKKALATA